MGSPIRASAWARVVWLMWIWLMTSSAGFLPMEAVAVVPAAVVPAAAVVAAALVPAAVVAAAPALRLRQQIVDAPREFGRLRHGAILASMPVDHHSLHAHDGDARAHHLAREPATLRALGGALALTAGYAVVDLLK